MLGEMERVLALGLFLNISLPLHPRDDQCPERSVLSRILNHTIVAVHGAVVIEKKSEDHDLCN